MVAPCISQNLVIYDLARKKLNLNVSMSSFISKQVSLRRRMPYMNCMSHGTLHCDATIGHVILSQLLFYRYHSESGWHTLAEVVLEHYGLEVNQATITIFVCVVPVIIDVFVKIWVGLACVFAHSR